MKKLSSTDVPTARSIGAQKLGQPVPLSNFVSDVNRGNSQPAQQTLRALARYPSRTAFAWPGGSLSYQGATDLIGRMQSVFMRLGFAPGTRVALLTANRADSWCAGVAAQLSRLAITCLHPLGSLETSCSRSRTPRPRC